MNDAFELVKSVGGIASEATYPYQSYYGADSYACGSSSAVKLANVYQSVNLASGDESALLAAVKTIGPVAVGIDASLASFTK